jgi:hypothetical protein
MFNFNLKKTSIYKVVLWQRNIFLRFAKYEKKLFFIFFIITLLIFLYGFLPPNFSFNLNQKLLGFSTILLVFTIISWMKESFLKAQMRFELKAPLEQVDLNLAQFLSFRSARAVFKSIRFAKAKKLSRVR